MILIWREIDVDNLENQNIYIELSYQNGDISGICIYLYYFVCYWLFVYKFEY